MEENNNNYDVQETETSVEEGSAAIGSLIIAATIGVGVGAGIAGVNLIGKAGKWALGKAGGKLGEMNEKRKAKKAAKSKVVDAEPGDYTEVEPEPDKNEKKRK